MKREEGTLVFWGGGGLQGGLSSTNATTSKTQECISNMNKLALGAVLSQHGLFADAFCCYLVLVHGNTGLVLLTSPD